MACEWANSRACQLCAARALPSWRTPSSAVIGGTRHIAPPRAAHHMLRAARIVCCPAAATWRGGAPLPRHTCVLTRAARLHAVLAECRDRAGQRRRIPGRHIWAAHEHNLGCGAPGGRPVKVGGRAREGGERRAGPASLDCMLQAAPGARGHSRASLSAPCQIHLVSRGCSTMTGTYAGQFVMGGFLNLKVGGLPQAGSPPSAGIDATPGSAPLLPAGQKSSWAEASCGLLPAGFSVHTRALLPQACSPWRAFLRYRTLCTMLCTMLCPTADLGQHAHAADPRRGHLPHHAGGPLSPQRQHQGRRRRQLAAFTAPSVYKLTTQATAGQSCSQAATPQSSLGAAGTSKLGHRHFAADLVKALPA